MSAYNFSTEVALLAQNNFGQWDKTRYAVESVIDRAITEAGINAVEQLRNDFIGSDEYNELVKEMLEA